MSDMTTVSVSVPSDLVGDLYAFAAQLHSNGGANGSTVQAKRMSRGRDTVRNGGAYGGTVQAQRTSRGRDTVRKLYLGGTSENWKPFLNRLAEEPDEWVAWSTLCEAIGLDAKRASGMLGAAERRCKGAPPYEKTGYDNDAGEYWFMMPAKVATYVKEAAAELAE